MPHAPRTVNDPPAAQLTITKVEGSKGPLKDGQQATFALAGNLTIHGETKPVTFATTATRLGTTIVEPGRPHARSTTSA